MVTLDSRHSAFLIASCVQNPDGTWSASFDIYSERTPTSLVTTVHAVVAAADGPFHEASAALEKWARDFYPHLAKSLEADRV